MAMGECSAYSSLQADSKVKFAAWPASWRPPGADRLWPRGTSELSHMAGAVDDGTKISSRLLLLLLLLPLSFAC